MSEALARLWELAGMSGEYKPPCVHCGRLMYARTIDKTMRPEGWVQRKSLGKCETCYRIGKYGRNEPKPRAEALAHRLGAEAVALMDAGLKFREVAVRLGCSQSTVARALYKERHGREKDRA